MLLLNSADLSVYEVAETAVSHRARLPPAISFERFESTARSHFYGLFLAAHMPSFRVGAETLVFVQLPRGRGWAWASRICVAHRNELPIANVHFGDEFLVLWPVPMAINAYINYKDRARRFSAEQDEVVQTEFAAAIKAHPPSTAFVPQQFWEDSTETIRKLHVNDMTVSQRLFVASLTPHRTPFSPRLPNDKWAETLSAQDQLQLHGFLQKHNPEEESRELTAAAQARKQHVAVARTRRQGCSLDLPDDLVERILSIHMAQNMECVAEMHEAVVRARLVCQQFRRTANAAIRCMLSTVVTAAHSLLGNCPREPVEVQCVVRASGLTLRHALSLHPGRWHSYARRRLVVEKRDGARTAATRMCSRQRCALLWGIGVA
tara:strand:- start:4955 stop:6085 length:1131 start_codon:yes stop_codon:yes gene_type:complete